MDIILKLVQTATLTNISDLLDVFYITRFKDKLVICVVNWCMY